MLQLENVYQAAFALKSIIRNTELIRAPKINPDVNLYIKPENLQITGSFKVRGAAYKISRLTDEEKARGVIACSAGNHAQGVALAAQRNNIKAVICLPDVAPISKIEATRSYGAQIELVNGVYDDAYQRALQLRDEMGYTFIHPFDDDYVIAGQGTIAIEILNENPDVEAIVVPVGGGGLISGIAYTVKMLRPDVKVYGVQAQGAPSMVKSVGDGNIITLDEVRTFADGIAVKQPGENTFTMCSKYVDDFVTVTDDETANAILALMENQKLVAEGAGAVSVAAVMFNKLPVQGKNTVCVVSGGNIDVTILSRIIDRGLLKSGRLEKLSIELTDKPGQLRDMSAIIAQTGANIVAVNYEHAEKGTDINSCIIRIELETKNRAHIKEVRRALAEQGFKILN
ncbi:MAG: threonine ammonia-lyase [Clostridia bacterium]|nr:threonine ammonia-lyase [Clostridia bacterium]